MTEALIFDVDGTLIDTVDLHAAAWVEALRHFDVEVAYSDMRAQIGKGGDQILHGLLAPEVLAKRGEEIRTFRGELFRRNYLHNARPFPGVRELFLRIREGGQRAVLASSGTAEEVEAYKQVADIADLIHGSTSASDAERSKPFPDIFQAALRLLEAPASSAVVIGDTPYDAEAARSAGLASVGVLCGGFPEDALRKAGCLGIYEGPADVLRQFDASPLAVLWGRR